VKIMRFLMATIAFSLALSPTVAQSRSVKRAMMRSFGPKLVHAPTLRRTQAYGAYEVIFPGSDLPPVRMESPDGYARSESRIQKGLKPPPTADQRNSAGSKMGSLPPPLILAGRVQTVDMGRFLTDPTLWTPAIRNDIKYQLGRTYFKQDAYWYFGPAHSHGKTYVGVCWYSPAASDMHDTYALVLRLDLNGQVVKPTPVHQIPGIVHAAGFSPPLILDTLPNGDLMLIVNNRLEQMNQKGKWSAIPGSFMRQYLQATGYTALWKRGEWVLEGDQKRVGNILRFHLLVRDPATFKKAREFTWSVAVGKR
jgi:hypothetical protein